MRRVLTILLCVSVFSGCGKEEAEFRANIGKTAFNGVNGTKIGKIVGVAQVNGTWVYQVEREGGRTMNTPVSNTRVAESTAADAASTTPPSPEAKVDSALTSTAVEFSRRLRQYDATLTSLTLDSDTIAATWTSPKCAMLEGEVIDLLLSVNRSQKASPSIRATRTCEGQASNFVLSGSDFQRYRTGQINDPQVLKGIEK